MIPVGSQVSVTVGENRIVKREVVTGATKGALSCAQEVCGDVSGEVQSAASLVAEFTI